MLGSGVVPLPGFLYFGTFCPKGGGLIIGRCSDILEKAKRDIQEIRTAEMDDNVSGYAESRDL